MFVDFLTSPPRRAVSAREPDPGLIAALGEVTARSCPVISSAVSRCTPEACGAITVVRGRVGPRLGFRELGVLSQIGRLAGVAAERLWAVPGGTCA